MKMKYVIKDRSTLEKLQRDKTLKRIFRSIAIELDAPIGVVNALEKRINRYYFACGCTLGEIAVVSTLFVFGALWLLDRNSSLLNWRVIVACVFAAALTGKVAGLVLSRILLRRTYSELDKIIA
jgi:hypothetical protein